MIRRKGFILYGALFLSIFLPMILATLLMRLDYASRLEETQRASITAFYCAENGIEATLRRLRQTDLSLIVDPVAVGTTANIFSSETVYSTPFVPSGPTYPVSSIGNYSVDVKVLSVPSGGGGADLEITSVGTVPVPGRAAQVSGTINVKVTVEDPTQYFISTSGGNLVINPGGNIAGDIMARDITINRLFGSSPITINGDVNYTGNYVENGSVTPLNITGSVNKINPITFMGLDSPYYEANATAAGRLVSGDFTYSGDIDFANLSISGQTITNGLVYVDGDLHIKGEVQESMLFVATGDIYIDGNITYPAGCDTTDTCPQLGLFSNKDVIISQSAPQNTTVEAFIFAHGTGDSDGVFTAQPNTDDSKKNTINFNGAIAVRGQGGANMISLNDGFNNRNLNYDTSLGSNLKIPFMSFLATPTLWEYQQ